MSSARIVPEVVREHAGLAAFFWAQRDTLSQEDPPPDPGVIAGIDRRLAANLDGLRIAGPAAWRFIIGQYEDHPEKGELFVAAVMALEQGDARRIEQVVEFARASLDARGFIGALAWLPPRLTGGLVREWLAAADPLRRWLGASAIAEYRADPQGWLHRLLKDGDARVRATGFRLAGLAGRVDVLYDLRAGLEDADELARFWAASALAELGYRDGDAILKARIVEMKHGWQHTLRTLVAAAPAPELRAWLRELSEAEATRPIAVRAVGMLKDFSLLSSIVHQASDPALAQESGAALTELRPDLRREDDLWSVDPDLLGQAFTDYFGESIPLSPVVDRVLLRLKRDLRTP